MRLSTRDCSLSEAELIEIFHHRITTHKVVLCRKALTEGTRLIKGRSNVDLNLGLLWFGFKLSRGGVKTTKMKLTDDFPGLRLVVLDYVMIMGGEHCFLYVFHDDIFHLESVTVSNDPLLKHASPTEFFRIAWGCL